MGKDRKSKEEASRNKPEISQLSSAHYTLLLLQPIQNLDITNPSFVENITHSNIKSYTLEQAPKYAHT
jgi:hypothetical protein